jgi:hypothetical protein
MSIIDELGGVAGEEQFTLGLAALSAGLAMPAFPAATG